MKFIILTIILTITLNPTSPVLIDCNFNTNTAYEVIGSAYQCDISVALSIKSREDAVIEFASGTHLASRTNDDVICFNAIKKNVNYIPRGLEKFFKNLKGIYIPYGRVKELRQVDLKSYPKLVYLDLGECDIKVIEDGTFDYNPNLEVIWLVLNKIIHIDSNVFDNLKKLSFLGLRSNPCVDVDVRNNLEQVKALLKSVKEKCFDQDFYKISQDLKSLENDAKSLKLENFDKWNENRENLEENFKISRFTKIDILTERFENLRQKIPVLQVKFLNQVENNLKNSQVESCSVVDGKLSEFGEKLENFDENLTIINQNLNRTDQKIENLTEKFSNVEEKIENCENLKNFTKIIYEKLETIESGQQTLKFEVENLSGKIERKFNKIDERTKKVIEALDD